jgi:membrane-bound lytic murein transglycosylase D
MLNKKLNITGSLLMILLLTVLSSNARLNTDSLNNPTTKADAKVLTVPHTINEPMPQFPLHPSMESFIVDYANDFDELFEKMKLNKSGYFKTIDKVFAQQEVPLELKYLAVVESQLKIDARSGVGAVGLWQFMPTTAKQFGLKITAKYDERQHVWKSSVAAAKYLNELYDIFGDWLLVIASYNSGPAPVLNAIKKSGSRNFWKIQYMLPKETRLHVKRFIATHYYFEGGGSMVTLGKIESEKYLKALEEFEAKNNADDENNESEPLAHSLVVSKWVAIIGDEKYVTLVLKK